MPEAATAPAPALPEAPTKNSQSAIIGLLLVQVFFASFPVAGKLAFAGFEPMAVAQWRVFVAAAVFMGVAWFRHRDEMRVSASELIQLSFLSLLGVTLNQVLFIRGLQMSSATNAGLLMPVIPVATYGFALALKREPFRPRRVAGLVLASGGIALLFAAGEGASVSEESVLGDLMMVANACCYALYMVLAKPMLSSRPPLVVMGWVFLFGAICVPFLSFGSELVPADADSGAWAALAWIIVFPTLIAYFLNLWALKTIDATVVGIFICLQPLISVSTAVLFLGEPFSKLTLACGALVIAGVLLVSIRRRRPRAI